MLLHEGLDLHLLSSYLEHYVNSADPAASSSAEDLDYNISDAIHVRYQAARELRYKVKQPDAQTNEAFWKTHNIQLHVKGYTTAIKWAKKFADNGHAFRYRYLDDVWDIVAADTSYRYSNAEWFKKKKNKAVER
ncbi:hypothetical protein E4U35_008109 [Claviceps purpurea]|nr:hypothetical protein E4U35_008109 [Claviceps purpurea]